MSGVNFLTGILLARFLGLEEYGRFVVLFSVMFFLNGIQNSLTIAPMMSLAPNREKREEYLRGVFSLQLLAGFILALAGSLFVAGFSSLVGTVKPSLIVAFALTVAAFQLQDWLRRYYFTVLRPKAVFVNDCISYLGQLLLLLLIESRFGLNTVSALACIALSSLAAVLYALWTDRLRPSFGSAPSAFRANWRAGRDLLLATQLQWAGSQGVLLVGAGILGPQVAGGIRAAQNLVGFLNTLLLVVENTVPVKAAYRYAHEGLKGLEEFFHRTNLLGGFALCALSALLVLLSEPLIQLLYGTEYRAYSFVVFWQALYFILGFFYRQLTYFHRTVSNTTVIAGTSLLSSALSLLLVLSLAKSLTPLGIMLALVAGQAASLLSAEVAKHRFLRRRYA